MAKNMTYLANTRLSYGREEPDQFSATRGEALIVKYVTLNCRNYAGLLNLKHLYEALEPVQENINKILKYF